MGLKEERKWVNIITMQMEKANKKSWMSLFAYARLELPEIAESL